jgi:hypothetical protein
MPDINDLVNQLSALRGALQQMQQPQLPQWPMAPPQSMPTMPAFNPATLQALQQMMAAQHQPQESSPAPLVDEEMKRELKNVAMQVQALANAMQMMANQMSALVATTRARLETLAEASLARARKADELPKEVLPPLPPPPNA